MLKVYRVMLIIKKRDIVLIYLFKNHAIHLIRKGLSYQLSVITYQLFRKIYMGIEIFLFMPGRGGHYLFGCRFVACEFARNAPVVQDDHAVGEAENLRQLA